MPNANDPGAAFTAITQIGTELAVLIYFRRDIIKILRAWFKRDGSADARLGTLIIIGTLPIIISWLSGTGLHHQ
jgi:undecaprenyl-diphosphatase